LESQISGHARGRSRPTVTLRSPSCSNIRDNQARIVRLVCQRKRRILLRFRRRVNKCIPAFPYSPQMLSVARRTRLHHICRSRTRARMVMRRVCSSMGGLYQVHLPHQIAFSIDLGRARMIRPRLSQFKTTSMHNSSSHSPSEEANNRGDQEIVARLRQTHFAFNGVGKLSELSPGGAARGTMNGIRRLYAKNH
jgi:hypothetical protein